jgi:hypothetical protein
MNKYIPKVGEAFEWETLGGWKKENAVVFENEKQIVVINCKGFMDVISKDINFRPAPTKSDVERERLIDILNSEYGTNKAVFSIQKAGFMIPKKIKRSDIYNTFKDSIESAYFINAELATDAICELLGDLVEQDEGDAK